jgi:hypothetical protein
MAKKYFLHHVHTRSAKAAKVALERTAASLTLLINLCVRRDKFNYICKVGQIYLETSVHVYERWGKLKKMCTYVLRYENKYSGMNLNAPVLF